jgi:hypothetical protein
MNDQQNQKRPNGQDDPLELRREIVVEKVGRDFAKSGEAKRVVKREMDVDGILIQETETEYARLSCGHVAPPKGICACGRSYCAACLGDENAGSSCAVCGRFVANCCRHRSVFDPSRVYCPRCRWFGWLHWLLRG